MGEPANPAVPGGPEPQVSGATVRFQQCAIKKQALPVGSGVQEFQEFRNHSSISFSAFQRFLSRFLILRIEEVVKYYNDDLIQKYILKSI